MPSYIRQRSSSPIYTLSIPEALPTKVVGFAPGPTPVTAISRPLNNAELWILYDFEVHARTCPSCRDPLSVHRAHYRLCTQGHRFAQSVASIVWSKADGREVYDAQTVGGHRTRVEIPQNYQEVRSLLRAMERSLRHRSQRPIVSFDRTYIVPERTPKTITRTPERRYSVKETSPSRTKSYLQSSPSRSRSVKLAEPAEEPERRAPEIVDWPEAEYEIREPSRVIQPSHSVRPPTPGLVTQRPTERAASPSKSHSPSKRSSMQPTKYSYTPAPEVTAKPPSRTGSPDEKKSRRQSMFVQSNAYNTEFREPPKGRSKRFSTVLF